jgi:hypothetical protein
MSGFLLSSEKKFLRKVSTVKKFVLAGLNSETDKQAGTYKQNVIRFQHQKATSHWKKKISSKRVIWALGTKTILEGC